MGMNKYLLGVDNGSTVSKAAIFNLTGDELAVASRKTKFLTPHHGHAERDMDEIWNASAESIKEVISKSGIAPSDIVCVACTGHGNGLYLVDSSGRPVRNAIMSTDSRAREYSDKWIAEGIDKEVLPKTMQSIWAAQPNTLLAWLIDNEPDTIAKTSSVLMCKDFIRYKLTGELHAELTDMSATSLMNLQTKQYDADLLKVFGIEQIIDNLPPLVNTADICGHVTKEASIVTGLAEGTPVAGGMFDIDAAGLASGMVDESSLCMIAGTWGNNQYISKNPVVSENVFMTSCYSIPDYYLMLEGSATSASNLEWFVTEFFREEAQRLKEKGSYIFEFCNELVAETNPEDSNVIFLPFLYGSNAHPNAKSCFIGIDGWNSRGQILRAIYEGIVFSHMTHVEKLLQFRKMPDVIQLTGGAANSKEWLQIFADAFQVPIEIPTGTELGTLGAAIAAGVASEIFKNYDEAVKSMVKVSKVIEPDRKKADLYSGKYDRYKNAIKNLNDFWNR